MWLDGRALDGRTLEADLCVIGGGPAALSLVHALALPRGPRVVLLESGGGGEDPRVQSLAAGRTTGDPYANLARSRSRRVGGTAHIWNTWVDSERAAKYAPLDPIDFEARSWVPLSGWPITRAELEPYYVRAHATCGLGPYTYDPKDWAEPDERWLATGPDGFTTSLYQFGAARRFTHDFPETLRYAEHVQLCTFATVLGLDTDGSGQAVTEARAACLTGERFRVRARGFVLAAGGIENARLLLLSRGHGDQGLGNRFDMVGRCFMDHPRDFSCTLFPPDRAALEGMRFYDVRSTALGALRGRLAPTEAALRCERLLNMSATLRRRWGGAALGWRDLLPEGIRRTLPGADEGPAPRTRAEALRIELEINLEQAPDRRNRVVLGTDRDAFGLRRALVHWRWREIDRASHARARARLAAALDRIGIGRLEIHPRARLDPDAHHHMGTTRMSVDPELGVVDPEGCVHGLSNLFIAGSSVFPTSGFANPTLTIVALSLRLADHLRARLGDERSRIAEPHPAFTTS